MPFTKVVGNFTDQMAIFILFDEILTMEVPELKKLSKLKVVRHSQAQLLTANTCSRLAPAVCKGADRQETGGGPQLFLGHGDEYLEAADARGDWRVPQ